MFSTFYVPFLSHIIPSVVVILTFKIIERLDLIQGTFSFMLTEDRKVKYVVFVLIDSHEWHIVTVVNDLLDGGWF